MSTSRIAAYAIFTLSLTSAALQAQERPTDEWLTNPVDDRTFATYLDFFAYDQQMPFDTKVSMSSDREGLVEEDLSYQSTPGVRVAARLYRPRGNAPANPGAIVFLHGGEPQAKNSAISRQLSRLMARAGWLVLSIDMLHWGERNTGLLSTFAEQEKHERLYNQPATYLEFVTQTVKDVSRGYDFLVGELGADPDRVAIVGFSRGGQLASIVGGADRRLAAVALLHVGHFDFFETGHRAAACPANYIGRISPRPLLMINGQNDADYLPDTAVRPLQRLAKQPHQFRWTEEGHGFLSEDDRTVIVEWLREHVH
jgi:acetyl esterase/lipase